MTEIQYITAEPQPMTIAHRVDDHSITMYLDKPDNSVIIEFKPEGIWVNGIQKDVDNEWPEIYTAFKQFVRGSST